MMDNRVLMSKFKAEWLVDPSSPGLCSCLQPFEEGETVLLYPNPKYEDIRLRDIICMTCHFWFVHEVLQEMEYENDE